MRHHVKKVRLNRKGDHRRWLLRNLVASLVERGKIVTTLAKAKFLQPKVEELISLAKQGGLDTRRRLYAFFPREKAAKKLLGEWAPLFRERNGGYTRLIKLNPRRGDNALLASLEFVVLAAGEEKGEKKGISKVKKIKQGAVKGKKK